MAADLVLAKTISDEGHFVLTKNFFPSTELHLLHTQLLQALLFRFTSDFRLVFTISFMIFMIMIILLAGMITKVCTGDLRLFFAPAVLILVPVGEYYEFLYRSQAYIAYVFFIFLFLFLYLLIQGKREEIKAGTFKVLFCFLILLTVLMGACGKRYFASVILPVVLYRAVVYLKKDKSDFRSYQVVNDVTVVIASLLGYGIFRVILSRRYNVGSVGDITWTGISAIKENLYHIPLGLFQVFGAFDASGERILSGRGIVQGVTILGIGLTYVIIVRYLKARKTKTDPVTGFTVSSTLLMLLILVFSKLGQEWGRPLEPHYLALSLCTLPIALTIALKAEKERVLVWGTVLLLGLRLVGMDYYYHQDPPMDKPGYAVWLENSGLSFGYVDEYDRGTTLAAYTNGKVSAVWADKPLTETLTPIVFNNRADLMGEEPEFVIMSNSDSITTADFAYPVEEVYRDDQVVVFRIITST